MKEHECDASLVSTRGALVISTMRTCRSGNFNAGYEVYQLLFVPWTVSNVYIAVSKTGRTDSVLRPIPPGTHERNDEERRRRGSKEERNGRKWEQRKSGREQSYPGSQRRRETVRFASWPGPADFGDTAREITGNCVPRETIVQRKVTGASG